MVDAKAFEVRSFRIFAPMGFVFVISTLCIIRITRKLHSIPSKVTGTCIRNPALTNSGTGYTQRSWKGNLMPLLWSFALPLLFPLTPWYVFAGLQLIEGDMHRWVSSFTPNSMLRRNASLRYVGDFRFHAGINEEKTISKYYPLSLNAGNFMTREKIR